MRPRTKMPKQLVGLKVEHAAAVLPMGAHLVSTDGNSIGWVGSSYKSPNLGYGVALAQLENGASRHGDMVRVYSMGQNWTATVTSSVFFDPSAARLHA